ncbi:MAG TPA: hypothetical protein PLB95_07255 [Syntrophales bacterium]|nr:hypothetical protein [Thermodesulfobacteriota bacterium]HPX81677.1 hypothetical protein [Syntrophales bacterium]
MNEEPFSKRHGFRRVAEVEITVRHDAPYDLRGVLVELAYRCGFGPKSLRSLVCRVLLTRPDSNNWSEYPNIDEEVRGLLDNCDWYRVYDVAEALYQRMAETPFSYDAEMFQSELNEHFVENGIGWQLANGRMEVRGPEALQEAVQTAKSTLELYGHTTAQRELHEALIDLSRRPEPDVSGAVQHSMAALECVAREVVGDPRATLGEIIKRESGLIPKPLDEAVAKAWGYASEHARHIREGRASSYEEAELVVGISASVSTYLVKKRNA